MIRTCLILCLVAAPVFALEPKDVFIVANKDVKESREVALHYATKRKVPKDNIIALSLPKSEDITRADFDRKLATPLREALANRKDECKVVLAVYGVPLRVGAKIPSAADKREMDTIKADLEKLKKDQAELATAKTAQPTEAQALNTRIAELNTKMLNLGGDQSVAAVESELMLLWWPKAEPTRWIMNPLFWQMDPAEAKKAPRTLMTCRLDGPTPEIAKRLVDDAIDTEATGLIGKAYFDARGQKFTLKNKAEWTGYEGYDEGFREAATLMKKAGFETVLDDKDPVFQPGTCPDAALYAGWYSHANFVDSNTFVKGAVAWHLASSEAITLHQKDSKLWCPNLLKKGVCATLGPVAEPYTVAFPKASEFFGFLVTGDFTLVECFARTTILTGWQLTLIGDPLYNPFAKSPKLKVSDVEASPWGQKK